MKNTFLRAPFIMAGLLLTLGGQNVFAVPIFSATDAILGGQSDGTQFIEGTVGGGNNQWPVGEGPKHLIDGLGQKYLNFGETLTGAIITPNLGSSIATSIQLWTANDVDDRDPASFELWGTNTAISGSSILLSLFTSIDSGSLALPTSRNQGGTAALQAVNSQTIVFSNSTAYTSYLLLFPTVKLNNIGIMQIAEAQLFSAAAAAPVPEPSTLAIFALGLMGLASRRFKKKS
ncbi:MAG: hypothetical protein ACI8Z9_000319 [Paraglaciecola sp.]|jgi:hypothetical protein